MANKNPDTKENVCDISEINELGKYQCVQYFITLLPALFVTMININYVFVAGDLEYRCRIPECEEENSTSATPPWWPNSSIGRCDRPILRDHPDIGCSNASFTDEIGVCTNWIYESNDTIVAELDLACQPWKINLIGTIHNVGMLFSMIFSGWIADRFGRKPALILCSVSGVIGHFKTLATSYYPYMIVEFLESSLTGGIYPVTSVLLIESGSKNNRVLAGILFSCIVYLGESIFAIIAMVVPYWKTLIHIICFPSIFFISLIYFLNESPRWQMLNDKTDQTKKALEIAEMNKVDTDQNDVTLEQKFNIHNYKDKEGYKEIFKSKEVFKRLLVASYCRFVVGFVYYGLMINSVLLPGNKYTNFLLSTVMSFPGELIALYSMNKIGRKLPLIVGYILCGAMCVASACVQAIWAKIGLYLVGKMVISACFTGIITYTMELYPTSTRGSLLGIGAFTSRIGAMLAPLSPMLIPISPALPTVLFGTTAFIGGCLLSLTPETKDLPLMDTIDQVEAIARTNRHRAKNSISKI